MQSVHFNTRPAPPRSPPTFQNLLPLHEQHHLLRTPLTSLSHRDLHFARRHCRKWSNCTHNQPTSM